MWLEEEAAIDVHGLASSALENERERGTLVRSSKMREPKGRKNLVRVKVTEESPHINAWWLMADRQPVVAVVGECGVKWRLEGVMMGPEGGEAGTNSQVCFTYRSVLQAHGRHVPCPLYRELCRRKRLS